MLISISLVKIIPNRAEAEKLVDEVKDKIKDIEGLEAHAQLVDKLTMDISTPTSEPS